MDIVLLAQTNGAVSLEDSNDDTQEAEDLGFFQEEENLNRDIGEMLRKVNAKEANDLVQVEWLTKKGEILMIVASLIANIAVLSVVSPPGGAWQDDMTSTSHADGHIAGQTVMAYQHSNSYPWFLCFNTIAFVCSLSTILLLISGLHFTRRAYIWCLIVIMWVTIISTAISYAIAMLWVTPKKDRKSLGRALIAAAVVVWCIVMSVPLLLHTLRLVRSGLEERRRRITDGNEHV